MIKVGSMVRYNRKDNAEDIETGFYPPIGTRGTVVHIGSDKDIEVKWEHGVRGDGVWWCATKDVIEVEFSLKDLIEEKVDEIFLAYQKANDITNGDIEPLDWARLKIIENDLEEMIRFICTKQKGETQ